jgi:hypothetical protein
MRKSEIKLGTIYAHKPHDWSTPEPLVFLSDHLYRERWWGDRITDRPGYLVAEDHYHKPEAGRYHISPTVGYPVLIYEAAYNVTSDVLVLLKATKPKVIETGLYDPTGHLSLILLTRMASVTGEYDEVIQAIVRQKDNDRRLREEHTAESNRLMLQRDDLTARLEVLGIKVRRDYNHDDRLSFELDELDKLVGRLEKLTQLEGTTSLTTVARLLAPGR